jgi:hypothetical protein
MPAEAVRDAAPGQGRRTPVGTLNVVDPHPLNWLYITWNTMEEPVRTDEKGNTVGRRWRTLTGRARRSW